MPGIFQTRIRHVELSLSPFSAEQMANIGEIVLGAKKDRIARGVGSQDSPAKALTEKYARRKLIRNRAPIRDWNYRGLTMRSAKVTVASEDKITLGFTHAQADKIVTAQRRMAEMWSDSPSDTAALNAIVGAELQRKSVVSVRRTA